MRLGHEFPIVGIMVAFVLVLASCAPNSAELQQEIQSEAEEITSKAPCSATLEDVERAVETAAEAQKIPGMEEVAERLMDWAQKAFLSYAGGRGAAGADAQERTELAVTAQQLGLDELAQDLMTGNPITSPCNKASDWEGTMTGAWYEPGNRVEFGFSFLVDERGNITGSGQGEYTASYERDDPEDYCFEYVTNPLDAEISGNKTGETFNLEIVLTLYFEQIACEVFKSPPPPIRSPEAWPVSILAQDGADADCTGGIWVVCRLQIFQKK